jgi:MFS family permease
MKKITMEGKEETIPEFLPSDRVSRWSVVGILILAHAVGMLQRTALSVVRNEISADFALSDIQFGLVASMYFYAYMVGQIPMGYSTDHIGPRRTASVGLLFVAVGSVASALTNSLSVLYLGRFLMGLAASSVFISIMKVQSTWFQPREFATVSGFAMLLSNFGTLAAQVPMAFLVSLISWRVIFTVIGLFCLLIAWSIWLLVRDRPDGSPSSYTPRNEKVPFTAEIRQILETPGMKAAIASYCLMQGPYMAMTSVWGVSYVMENYGVNAIFASFPAGCLIVGMMAGGLLFGWLSDRCGKRRFIIAVLSSLHLAMWIVLAVVDKLPMWGLFAVFLGIGVASASAILFWTVMKELGHPSTTGLAISIGNMSAFLSSALCSFIMGILLDFFSDLGTPFKYQRSFCLCIAAVSLSLFFQCFLPETGSVRDHSECGA